MKNVFVTLLLLLFVCHLSMATPGQNPDPNISTMGVVVNRYSEVLAIDATGGTKITVNSVGGDLGGLAIGDLIMIYQAQGATIATPNDKTYGNVTNYNNAGNYEYNYVTSVSGNDIFVCKIANSYTVSGHVQVVKVPEYANLTITASGSISAQPWDGRIGGIVAIHVQGTLTNNGLIEADFKGFRGGEKDGASTSPPASLLYVSYFDKNSDKGGAKGEGIAGYRTEYDNNFGGYIGAGAPANGGGGGTCHNSGGGGGSNAGDPLLWNGAGVMEHTVADHAAAWKLDKDYIAINNFTTSTGGGKGGYSYSMFWVGLDPTINGPDDAVWCGDSRRSNGGRGGHPLQKDNLETRFFFGGGGGAGDANNGVQQNGGIGGGTVYIIAKELISPTGKISAKGESLPFIGSTTACDAPSGGGGGGTIILKANKIDNPNLNVDGGIGGSQNETNIGIVTGGPYCGITKPDGNEAEGPGGGGGAGVIGVSMKNDCGANTTNSLAGGSAGITKSVIMAKFKANGATNGGDGVFDQTVSQHFLPKAIYTCLIDFNHDTVDDRDINPNWDRGGSSSITTDGEICGPNIVTLKATAAVNTTFSWYDVLTGGVALKTETNTVSTYDAPYASSSTKLYYVETSTGGCSRTKVTATWKNFLTLSIDSTSVREDVGPTDITVTQALADPLNDQTYSISGTTQGLSDYTAPTSITITKNNLTASSKIFPKTDNLPEGDENFTFKITNPISNGCTNVISDDLLIIDIYEPYISITVDKPIILETGVAATGTGQAKFTLHLTKKNGISTISGVPVEVNLNVDGLATHSNVSPYIQDFYYRDSKSGLDTTYALLTPPIAPKTNIKVTIPPGDSIYNFYVNAISDATIEGNENISFSITNVTQGTPNLKPALLTASTVIQEITIVPKITFAIDSTTIQEVSGSGIGIGTTTVTATIDHTSTSDIIVVYQFGATTAANPLNDFTFVKTDTIFAGDLFSKRKLYASHDLIEESNELINISIASATNATFNPTDFVETTIIDNDPTVTLAVTPPQISELGGVATFTANLSKLSPVDVKVVLAFSGDATFTADATHTKDYSRSGADFDSATVTITIPAGQWSADMAVTAHKDIYKETNEEIIATISSVTNGIIGTNLPQITTIMDVFTPPTVNITINNKKITENNEVATVSIYLSSKTTQTVSVNLNIPATTAVMGSDYVNILPSTLALTFAPGDTLITFPITALPDLLFEPINEPVIVEIVSGSEKNCTLGIESDQTEIIDVYTPTVSITIDSAQIKEKGGVATITAKLNNPSTKIVEVKLLFNQSNSATYDTDYTTTLTTTLTITIPAGQMSGTAIVLAFDDKLVERGPNETIKVDIETASNAFVDPLKNTVYTEIIDNDNTPPTIKDAAFTIEKKKSKNGEVVTDMTDATKIANVNDINTNKDIDIDNDVITYAIIGVDPSNGAYNFNTATGIFTVADTAFMQPSQPSPYIFQVQATDSYGATSVATITITVLPNIYPVANDDYLDMGQGTKETIELISNDTNLDDGISTVSVVTNAAHGTVSINPQTHIATYTPDPNYFGLDEFTYSVCDMDNDCANAKVFIDVAGLSSPQGFSPNGDGINDTFIIPELARYRDIEMTVFNRWGNKVYENGHYENNWDGTPNVGILFGSELPIGTYFYVAVVKDNGRKICKYVYITR